VAVHSPGDDRPVVREDTFLDLARIQLVNDGDEARCRFCNGNGTWHALGHVRVDQAGYRAGQRDASTQSRIQEDGGWAHDAWRRQEYHLLRDEDPIDG
jgi:hypothetical protein